MPTTKRAQESNCVYGYTPSILCSNARASVAQLVRIFRTPRFDYSIWLFFQITSFQELLPSHAFALIHALTAVDYVSNY